MFLVHSRKHTSNQISKQQSTENKQRNNVRTETSLAYSEKLSAFGFDLGKYYNAFALCRNIKLAKRGLHCATFDKKWVFAYQIGSKSVIIHPIVWVGVLK